MEDGKIRQRFYFFFFCEVRNSLLEFNSLKKKTPTYDKLEELEEEQWNLKQRKSYFWVMFSLTLLKVDSLICFDQRETTVNAGRLKKAKHC